MRYCVNNILNIPKFRFQFQYDKDRAIPLIYLYVHTMMLNTNWYATLFNGVDSHIETYTQAIAVYIETGCWNIVGTSPCAQ